jgi:aryl-alcohol dehydrogenase-like predicted oxidoreductase
MGADRKGLSKAYILRAAEDSLRRLRTDVIDLYQAHYDDPDTPVEETLEAYAALVGQGKVKAFGASNFSAERISESLRISEQGGLPAYQSIQPRYNLYDRRDYESSLEPLCRKQGLGVITYYSLGSGFLTGKYRSEKDLSKSIRGQGVRIYLNERGLRILKALDQVAKRFDAAPASVSLAWIMARPGITAPIASATSLEQLNDLIAAVSLELDRDSMKLLNTASD